MIRIVALLILLVSSSAEAEEFAASLPENTLVYVSFPNAARTRERAKLSPLLALWDAPEMEAARSEADRLGRQGAEESIRASEFGTTLQGEVCIATIPVGETDSALLFLVDLKGDRAQLLDMLERARARDDREGMRSGKDDYRGYSVTTFRNPIDGADAFETTYAFVKGNVYGHCDNIDVVHDIIARLEVPEATNLTGVTVFRITLAVSGAQADLRFFVSADTWKRAFPPFEEEAFVIAALGLDILQSAGGGFTLDASGIQGDLLLLHDAKPTKLLGLFAADVAGLGVPAMVPADATQSVSWGIDWAYLHAELMRVLGEFAPPVRREVDALVAQTEATLGLRLRQDVLAALAPGSTFAFLKGTPDPNQAPPESPGWTDILRTGILIQELRNTETIAGLLEKLAKLEGAPMRAEAYLGTTIYEGTTPSVPSCAIIGQTLVLALSPDSLRTLIRREGKELSSFRDTPAYKCALALAPARRSLFAVHPDTEDSTGWFLKFNTQRSDPGAMGAAFFTAVPESTWLERYQGLNVLSIYRAEHGVAIRAFWGLRHPVAAKDRR